MVEASSTVPAHKKTRVGTAALCLRLALATATGIAVAGCVSETQQHGYVVSETALQQIPVGSSREQVLIVLGTPSTTATDDSDAFYYISQTKRRAARFAVAKTVDQRVLAVYFDEEERVARVADYGMKDGKVFDYISRTTPTTGLEVSFVGQLLQGLGRPTF